MINYVKKVPILILFLYPMNMHRYLAVVESQNVL